MQKELHAKLKTEFQASVTLYYDWEKNPLGSAQLVEQAKRDALIKIRAKLHEQVAVISLEDIEYKII